MAKGIIQHIAEELKSFTKNVLLVENNDKFLYRDDVIKQLKLNGVDVIQGSSIYLRLQYELKEADTLLIMLCQNSDDFLEDIKQNSTTIEFFLEKYFNGYHIPTLIDLDIEKLDTLFEKKQIISLNKKETLQEIEKINVAKDESKVEEFDLNDFIISLNNLLAAEHINWSVVCRQISLGIINTIGGQYFEELLVQVHKANEIFQIYLELNYKQFKNSSAVKKPKIVSKILEHIDINYNKDKVALIVIDGLAFWQYEILKDKLTFIKNEDVIYSWLPSITQLSRQAIFRGSSPESNYIQNPTNEEKLWHSYWKNKGLNDFEIKYAHETINLENLSSVSKFGIVFTALDEKMHSSTDYKDLKNLTENWIERSKITNIISDLVANNFKIFLTTDHGNIQAKGWRGLKGREKLGSNKSGSRSERHIEYSEKWLSDDFLKNNPEIKDSVVMEEQAIYFKNDLSFSSKESFVTHGGAHLLEVLIPFIEISNGE